MSTSKLALLGGDPVSIPSEGNYPRFSERAIERVVDLLKRGETVGLNKSCMEIEEAERTVSDWHGVDYCLGTASGHGALQSALIGLEITGGDEVITTPFTWGASVSCILHNNAVPVFADVDPETGLIDPESIPALVTERTKAILAVHIFGQPANMTRIGEIARQYNLVVIEDGSQAHGALHRDKRVGAFGDASGFSCMGGKLLATTEAGYMLTHHEEVYWKAAMGGQHMGRSPEAGFPDSLRPYADSLVYTYRLNPVTAVLLTEQLGKVDGEIEGRRANVERFRTLLNDAGSISFPDYAEGDTPSYHMITMNFNPEHAGVSRETYKKALRAEGVQITSYVPSPIPRWRRLQWKEYDGPRVMWTDMLSRAGVDYENIEIPGCDEKIARSLEMGWNYIDQGHPAVEKAAEAFDKVERSLSELREWERAAVG